MPRGDGTGPMGMGPMTGRGMGYCTGYNWPRFATRRRPRRRLWLFGFGRRMRAPFYADRGRMRWHW